MISLDSQKLKLLLYDTCRLLNAHNYDIMTRQTSTTTSFLVRSLCFGKHLVNFERVFSELGHNLNFMHAIRNLYCIDARLE